MAAKKPTPRMLEHLRHAQREGVINCFHGPEGFGLGTADKYQKNGWIERAGNWAAKGAAKTCEVGDYKLTAAGEAALAEHGGGA